MLGFGKSSRDSLADVKSAERWFATLPATDPLAVQRAVMEELAVVAGRDGKRTPAKLEAVFAVDRRTDVLRATLTSQYIEHASRSAKIEQQLWSALFDLTQSFLLAYQAFASEIAAREQSSKWQLLLPELLVRQVMNMARDAKTRLFRY